MAAQNLISKEMTPEEKTSITTKLNDLKTDVDKVVVSVPEDKNEYIRVGNIMLPFMDKIYDVVQRHPEILPSSFDKPEYFRDYLFTKDIYPIATLFAQINASLQATLFAVNSDTMVESLEVYAYVQQGKGKVPGLETDAAELKAFFKKPPRPPKPPKPPTQ